MTKLFDRVSHEEQSPSVVFNPGVDLSKLSKEDGSVSFKLHAVADNNNKKKKSSSRKSSSDSVSNAITKTSGQDDMFTKNIPYETKYQETTNILKGSIIQLDGILEDTLRDSSELRRTRNLKRKYDLLSLLNSNASNIIGNKIAAVREINNTISKCNDLELKRMKELNLAASAEDSDKKIMDMYNAFVSMPVGEMPMNGGPSLQQISHAINTGNVITATTDGEDNAAYQNYLNSMNPAQRLSMYESNPNIKQVIVYNQQDGSRYFEVMDVSTGEVIPGVDKHDAMFLEDVTLDLENKIARNINIGETYPIVVVGEPIVNAY